MLVRRDAELQRVDAMAVRTCFVQIRPQRGVDTSRFVVELAADVPRELIVAGLADVRAADAAPHENVALRGLEVPALRQIVRARSS